ncbi:MAG: HAD family hydrolase [Desulfobacula sp.]|nr:HAD family hydrolase [Desulfobacula sp.]
MSPKGINIKSNQSLYDAILFDLEGTLVDFQWNLKDAEKEIRAELSGVGIDIEQYGPNPDYAKLFNTTRDITKDWNPKIARQLFNRLDLIYDTYDRDALSRWQPYPDTKEALKILSQKGHRMGIVSNCGTIAVSCVLKKFNLSSYFELILSRNDVVCIKPDPSGLIKAAEHLSLPFHKILFVGDSLNDIIPANKIDMPSCFLLGGESRVTCENHHHATFEISRLLDLTLP